MKINKDVVSELGSLSYRSRSTDCKTRKKLIIVTPSYSNAPLTKYADSSSSYTKLLISSEKTYWYMPVHVHCTFATAETHLLGVYKPGYFTTPWYKHYHALQPALLLPLRLKNCTIMYDWLNLAVNAARRNFISRNTL